MTPGVGPNAECSSEIRDTQSADGDDARSSRENPQGVDSPTPTAIDYEDTGEFDAGIARRYPELPGEKHRNPNLRNIRNNWNQNTLRKERSRSNSFEEGEGSTIHRMSSPQELGRRPTLEVPEQNKRFKRSDSEAISISSRPLLQGPEISIDAPKGEQSDVEKG